jgi:hypothetical protein
MDSATTLHTRPIYKVAGLLDSNGKSQFFRAKNQSPRQYGGRVPALSLIINFPMS